MRGRAERGSAGVVVVGVVGATVLFSGAWLGVSGVFVAHQRASATADAAALAAADAASGFIAGDPCSLAESLAIAHGTRIDSCVVDDQESRIVASSPFGGFDITAEARAGPPSFRSR